jgi:hypothetical protein
MEEAFLRFKESIMAVLSAVAPAVQGAGASYEGLVAAPAVRFRQGLTAVWQFLEGVGSVRAAAELERRARSFDQIDPARAALLHDAARRCLDRV